MKKKLRLVIIFSLLTLSFLPMNQMFNDNTTAKAPESNQDLDQNYYYWYSLLDIDIKKAYYDDLDYDGDYDDVYTLITITPYSSQLSSAIIDIYQFVQLPSGDTWYFTLTALGLSKRIYIEVQWYDIATESGWYTFLVSLDAYTYSGLYTYDEAVMFDPPEEGPEGGMPRVDYSYW
jgi:hypothetical protein